MCIRENPLFCFAIGPFACLRGLNANCEDIYSLVDGCVSEYFALRIGKNVGVGEQSYSYCEDY